MYQFRRRVFPAIVAGAIGLGAVAVRAEQPASPAQTQDQQDLATQVQELKHEVADLKANQTQNQADVAAAIKQVIADADRQSQMLTAGANVTYEPMSGVKIASDDGSSTFHPWLQMDFRYIANYTVGNSAVKRNNQDGFELRRMKFGFDGTAFTPDFSYNFQWATNRGSGNTAVAAAATNTSAGGTPILEEAWFKWMFDRPWGVRAGEFHDPLSHEALTSSKRQQAIERSYLGDVIGLGDNYIEGISAIYDKQPLRVEVAFTNGTVSSPGSAQALVNANTNFQAAPGNSLGRPNNFGIAGRAEYFVNGKKPGEYDKFTAMGNTEDLLVVGAGGDWSQSAHPVPNGTATVPFGTPGNNVYLFTVDADWQNTTGTSVFVSDLGRYTQIYAPAAGTRGSYTDNGVLLQAGQMLNKNLEVFGRYDFIQFDGRAGSPVPPAAGFKHNFHEFTVGVNYYVWGQSLKFTGDVDYLPNGAPVGDSGADILKTPGGEFVARAQVQLLL